MTDQGAGQGSPLAHAAGELVGIVFLKSCQANQVDELFYAGLFFLKDTLCPQAKGDVVINGQPREEGVVLEHEAPVAARLGDGGAVQSQRSAVRLDQPGDEPQQGGFTAPGGADEGDKRTGGDVQIDIGQGSDDFALWVGELLAHPGDRKSVYHLMTPFCQTSTWSRARKSRVMMQ